MNKRSPEDADALTTAIEPGALPVDKPRVQSASRALGILRVVARSENGLRAKEIKEELNLPKQVTYHLIHTLVSIGMLRKSDSTRYVLGLGIAPLAEGFRRHLAPPEYLAPLVRALASRTGETAYAVGWVDGDIVVLASTRGKAAVHAAEVPHGYGGDAHARASGKLLLALSPPHLRDAYISHLSWARRTPRTITDRGAFMREIERVQTQGYAVDEEEFMAGLSCLAVPVEPREAAYALCISAPTERFRTDFDKNLTILREIATSGMAT